MICINHLLELFLEKLYTRMGTQNILRSKTDYELLMMVNESFRYTTNELTNLLIELDRRGVSNDRVKDLKSEISDYQQKYYKQEKTEENQDNASEKPRLFPENSLFVFSIIFSTFFASIVMAFNLKEVNKQKAMLPLLFFGGLYTVTVASITQQLEAAGLILAIVLNGLGAFIILKYFWRPYIGSQEYEKRSMLTPLLIGLLIAIPLVYILSQNGMAI